MSRRNTHIVKAEVRIRKAERSPLFEPQAIGILASLNQDPRKSKLRYMALMPTIAMDKS